jgi:hypothetical protein
LYFDSDSRSSYSYAIGHLKSETHRIELSGRRSAGGFIVVTFVTEIAHPLKVELSTFGVWCPEKQ